MQGNVKRNLRTWHLFPTTLFWHVVDRCKTLIGSNEGSCSHKQWWEDQQCHRENRHTMGKRHLGLRIWTATNGHKCASARRRSKTDQRPEDRECGAGIRSDGISIRWLKAEWQQLAQWRHRSMTSHDTGLAAVGMQLALGIVQQTRTQHGGQRMQCVGRAGAKGSVGRGSQSRLGGVCKGLGWLRQ